MAVSTHKPNTERCRFLHSSQRADSLSECRHTEPTTGRLITAHKTVLFGGDIGTIRGLSEPSQPDGSGPPHVTLAQAKSPAGFSSLGVLH